MKRADICRSALFLAGVLAIAGCGGHAAIGLPATQPADQTLGPQTGKTWVFVSDPGTSQVFVYELPTLKLIQIITGFTQPQGECSDDSGDVWVTDGAAKVIYKLLHSGKTIGTLSDTYGVPEGCAWDPKTGNLAVMNLFGNDSQPGAVLVYHHATGVPNVYENPKQYSYDFGGFDGSGNLFFDGRTSQNKFVLSELPRNAQQAESIAVSGGKIYTPGMVQWDASKSQLAVGDQNCGNATQSCIYQLTIAKTTGTIAGKIALQNAAGGPVCDLVQGVLWQKSVIGSDFESCGSQASATYVWPYPAGGAPTSQNARDDSEPFGAAVSTGTGEAPARQPSWMDSIAKKVDLLYISDGNGEVTVYTYWQKTLVGQLTGFAQPMGECADKAGNVFVTDYKAQTIVEYAHAGKKPIATIDDSPYAPYACSVDLATGAIAVANEPGTSKQGNIAVYAGVKATPKLYTDSKISDFQACAYDSGGNLLASNDQAGSRYANFAWLPKGGSKLLDVTLPGPEKAWTWEGVNGIQWDGRYFVVDDYNMYRESIANGQGYYIGETSFDSGGGQAGPFWIYNIHPGKQGTQAVGVYNDFSYPYVYYWNYPAGGEHTAYITKGLDKPVAVTVSLGKIHE